MKSKMDRREFVKFVGLGASALTIPEYLLADTPADERPNIVFILTDDHRYDLLGCAEHPWVKTPNIDGLAREGVLFNNAFVTTSLCSPARASFLTGCYAHTHEVFRNDGKDPKSSIPTFPQLLQSSGYETAFIGKWHMADTDLPRSGFDRWVGFAAQGNYYGNDLNVDGKIVHATEYITDELTEYALRFIKKERKKPFMLYLSHKAIHAPQRPAKRHENLYSGIKIKSHKDPNDRLDNKPKWGPKARLGWDRQIRDCARTLASVDESVGRIIKTLETMKILDNTVIVFAGDNGFLYGEHGLWSKRSAYEESIRIPLIMRYPPAARTGTKCDQMVLNIDLAPTFLELAGVAIPATMQGQSWISILKGKPGRESFLYEFFHEDLYRYMQATAVGVRTKRWKYVTYPLADKTSGKFTTDEFYDLVNDPKELNNLINDPKYADIVKQMNKELESLKAKTNFRFPD